MDRSLLFRAAGWAVCLAAVIAVALAGCRSTTNVAQGFTLGVTPAAMEAIVGQRCCLLVTVAEEPAASALAAVEVSATAPDCEVGVNPVMLEPGSVGEVCVIPAASSVGQTVTVLIEAVRGDVTRTAQVTVDVIEGEDMLADGAAQIRDEFIPWLATNHPELGIDANTQWTGSIVSPNLLIVANYLFFADDWELGLSYHVMIAPHDWARIYLRRRQQEQTPSRAFEITSLEAGDDPIAIDPPPAVYR